jgi:hypothetical protein
MRGGGVECEQGMARGRVCNVSVESGEEGRERGGKRTRGRTERERERHVVPEK